MKEEIRDELVDSAEDFERLLYDVQGQIQKLMDILNRLEDRYGRRKTNES